MSTTSFLIWPQLQHAAAKTSLPWQSAVFPYLSVWFLIPADPQATVPSSQQSLSGDLHLLQPVSPPSFQSVQPTSLHAEQPRQRQRSVSDPVRGRGLWDRVCEVCGGAQRCPGPSHSRTTRSLAHPEPLPVLHAPFMVSALYCVPIFIVWAVFLLCLFHVYMCLDTQIPGIVLRVPRALSTVTGCTGLQPRAIGCWTVCARSVVGCAI